MVSCTWRFERNGWSHSFFMISASESTALQLPTGFWQSRERKWVSIFEIPLESGGVGWVKVTHQGCWLSDFHCLTRRLTKWHSIIPQHQTPDLVWREPRLSRCPPEGFPRWTNRCLLLFLSYPAAPSSLFQLHMLQGDGRQRGWLQFTPDIPGTIRNHFLPICLIAAIAYRSDLLSVSALSVPNDGFHIDLPVLKITKRRVQQPSRCASQLPTIYQLLVKGGQFKPL